MRQDSFSGSSCEKYRKKIRNEQRLEEMKTFIPCKDRCNTIEPHFLLPERAGCQTASIDSKTRLTHSMVATAANKTRNKLRVRTRVKHQFGILNQLPGFNNVRYREHIAYRGHAAPNNEIDRRFWSVFAETRQK